MNNGLLTSARKTIKIWRKEGEQLVALVVKEHQDWLSQQLDKVINLTMMFMLDRFKKVDPSAPGYKFDSSRFDVYNRFPEKVFLFLEIDF